MGYGGTKEWGPANPLRLQGIGSIPFQGKPRGQIDPAVHEQWTRTEKLSSWAELSELSKLNLYVHRGSTVVSLENGKSV